MPRKSLIIFVLGLATLALGLLIVVVPFTLSTGGTLSTGQEEPLHWLVCKGEKVRTFPNLPPSPTDADWKAYLHNEEDRTLTYRIEDGQIACYKNPIDIPYKPFLAIGSTLSIIGFFVAMGVFLFCRLAPKGNPTKS